MDDIRSVLKDVIEDFGSLLKFFVHLFLLIPMPILNIIAPCIPFYILYLLNIISFRLLCLLFVDSMLWQPVAWFLDRNEFMIHFREKFNIWFCTRYGLEIPPPTLPSLLDDDNEIKKEE